MRFYQFFVRILCKCFDFLDFPAIYHLCFYSSQSPGYLKESEGCFVFFGCRFREKIVEKVQKLCDHTSVKWILLNKAVII